MKSISRLSVSAAIALAVCSCASNDTPDDGLGYGPFDAQGNYREDLADNPGAWTKPGKRGKVKAVEEVPAIAANDAVPANSSPLVTRNDVVSHPQPLLTSTATTKPKTATTTSKPKVVSKPRVVSKPKTTPSTRTASKPKASSRTVAKAKVKPKKPTVTRYTVKSGDSLTRIASRNGTTVSALRSQNGIKGDLIRPGQSLTIPKR